MFVSTDKANRVLNSRYNIRDRDFVEETVGQEFAVAIRHGDRETSRLR